MTSADDGARQDPRGVHGGSSSLRVLESATVLWPDRTVGPGRITISGDRITAVEPLSRIPDGPSGPAVERVTGLVAPGLVDTHVHAGGGGDFASTDRTSVLRARDFHRGHGTTAIIASLVTDHLEQILAELELLGRLCDEGEFDGIHLETPFLSEAKCGAHPPALLRHPDPETVEQLIAAGGEHLSMITIAPELPGALDAIDRFVAAGVRVAVGHTAGTVDDAKAALDHGATVATHLFNAMNSIHHREPGPVPVLLTDPRVAVELICDGFHLAPEVVAMAIETAGADRTMLITDAMAAAGLADGEYPLGTLRVQVAGGQARLVDDDGGVGSIAGSTLTLADAVRNTVQFAGISVGDAVHLASATPARVHGLAHAGQIVPGARADLIVLDARAAVTDVLCRGEWLPATPAHQGGP